jgi:hypothetical protein
MALKKKCCHDYQRQMNGCLIRCLRTQRFDDVKPPRAAGSSRAEFEVPASGAYDQASFHMSHKRLVVVQLLHAIRNSS